MLFFLLSSPSSLSLSHCRCPVLQYCYNLNLLQRHKININTHLQDCRAEELDEAHRVEEFETSVAERCGGHGLHLHPH